jgi:HSP20 family protein
MIERYDPFGRTMSLRQMMDRLMEDAFVMPRGGQAGSGDGSPTATALNVFEEGDTLVVEANLPGMRPEDVDVTIERGTLTIRGETKADEERKERNYLVREYRRGSFARRVALPETVDPDACQATFENGVLRLTFQKSQQARPRRIQVSSGGQTSIQAGGKASDAQGAAAQRADGARERSGRETTAGATSAGA